jgi:serine protease
MRLTFHSLSVRSLAVAVAASALVVQSPRVLRAQTGAWVSPYPMILTAERALGFVEAADRKLGYLPGEVLVKFKDGVSVAGQQRALAVLRSRPDVSELRWVGDVALLRDPGEPDGRILAAALATQPEVAYAEPNYLYHPSTTPNDPSFSTRQWNFAAIDLPHAWDINPGATASTIVAVVDSGVTTVNQNFQFMTWDGTMNRNISVPFGTNPDLQVGRLTSARDFAFWTGPVLDMVGHGTHVSSTVGEETNNGIAEAGIAYKALIMPVKVCLGYWEIQFFLSANGYQGFAPQDAGGCSNADVASGIRYAADMGARVINISLGGSDPSTTVRNALIYAIGKGAFIAIANGNEFEDGNPVEYPAADAQTLDGAMSVGAVGRSLKRSFYSNTGAQLEIVAPGGDSFDGGAAGVIWQSTISQSDLDSENVLFPRFDRYVEAGFQGSSMASPHVAGVAALIMSQGVTKPAAVEALIKKTAKDLGAAGRDNDYGYGLVEPRPALFGLGVAR